MQICITISVKYKYTIYYAKYVFLFWKKETGRVFLHTVVPHSTKQTLKQQKLEYLYK
jgi:hypothetical protein